MTRREMKQRIRDLEKRVARLELGPTDEKLFEGPYIGFDGKNWTWSVYPPWHDYSATSRPKPGENGSEHRLT